MQNKFALSLLAVIFTLGTASAAEVRIQRVPGGGLQPQALTDARGALHLVYLQGDPKACDVIYSRREAGKAEFSAPLRVNSQPGSAIAIGTIRGAQFALGKGGRVHVEIGRASCRERV